MHTQQYTAHIHTRRLPKMAQYCARRPLFSFQHLAVFQKRSIHMTHLRTRSSVLSFCAPLLIFQALLLSFSFSLPSPRPLSRPLELSLSIIIWAHKQQFFFSTASLILKYTICSDRATTGGITIVQKKNNKRCSAEEDVIAQNSVRHKMRRQFSMQKNKLISASVYRYKTNSTKHNKPPNSK